MPHVHEPSLLASVVLLAFAICMFAAGVASVFFTRPLQDYAVRRLRESQALILPDVGTAFQRFWMRLLGAIVLLCAGWMVFTAVTGIARVLFR